MVFETRKQTMALMEHRLQISLRRCTLSMEGKVVTGDFGQLLRVMGKTSPVKLGCYNMVFVYLQILARQLAQVLLRGVCERTYEKPTYQYSSISGSTASLRGLSKVESKVLVNIASPRRTSLSLKTPLYTGERYVV